MAFKLKGSPFQRNFGISPMKDEEDKKPKTWANPDTEQREKKYTPDEPVISETNLSHNKAYPRERFQVPYSQPKLFASDTTGYVTEAGGKPKWMEVK